MLRHLLDEFPDVDFDELLPMVQWAYNTSMHAATGRTPYYALYGVAPREPMNLLAEPGTVIWPAAKSFAEHQAGVLAMTRDALYKAQATMLEYENRSRRDVSFAVGEHVFLSTVNLGSTHFSTTVKKLRKKYVGPFKIVEKRTDYKYRLKLSREFNGIYPVFHASLLWRAIPTPADMAGRVGEGVVLPAEGEGEHEGDELISHDSDGEEVFLIESVVARKTAGRGFQYLVKWKGYPPEDNSWDRRGVAATTGAARVFDDFDKAEDAAGRVREEPVPYRRRKAGPVEEPAATSTASVEARDSRVLARRRLTDTFDSEETAE